ncbi:cell wall-binding repeat-containing protein [Haloimpatiens sp. FM7330]|uniref:cell wall-binding repeat-containing protein n=1 Tax=Haloimpatiens sp. FM7330 TaxID=3298610 RepID=UPI003643F181
MRKNIKKFTACTMTAGLLFTLIQVPQVKAEQIRFNGSDRIDTAMKIAKSQWKDSAEYVVITAADNDYLLDALIAAPLAKAYNAPIVTNFKGDKVDGNTLEQLKKWKTKTVFIASGTKVFTKKFEDKLKSTGVRVIRVGDDNKEKTSLNVAKALKEKVGAFNKVCVVSEDNAHLVDSLSIAPIAGIENMPILVCQKDKVSKEIKDYITNNKIQNVYAIGGNGVLSDKVVNEMKAKRISGKDRYSTNVEVLKEFEDSLKFEKIYLASGANGHLVDAISGSSLAGKTSSPIILVGNTVSESAKEFMQSNTNEKDMIYIFGGEGAVSVDAADKAELIKNGEENGILKLSDAKWLSSRVILTKVKYGINKMTKDNFVVGSENNILGINSAQKAVWDKSGKTMIIRLNQAMQSGKIYSVNDMNITAENSNDEMPCITNIESTDYNKVEVSFSKPVDISEMKMDIQEENSGDKLNVSNINYVDGQANTVEITTSEQKGNVIYKCNVYGTKDFEGNYMKPDKGNTFTGTKKDTTTKLEIASAEALNPRNIMVTFNTRIDKDKVKNLGNYNVEEFQGFLTKYSVKAVRMAEDSDYQFKDSKTQKQSIVVTLDNPMKDSTIFNIKVSNLTTSTGVCMNTDKQNTDFIGIGPFTTQMDFTDKENKIIPISNKKIRVVFKRHMNKNTLIIPNFKIQDVYSGKDVQVNSLDILDDRTIDLTVSQMDEKLYKIALSYLKDVDGNTFEIEKCSRIFKGSSKDAQITKIEKSELLSDDVSLVVTFDNVLGKNALNTSNYIINNGVGHPSRVQKVEGKQNAVKLTVPKTVNNVMYKLTVRNLQDIDGKSIEGELISNFSGRGSDGQALKVVKAEAVDRHTLKICFNMSVKSPLIDGENRIWNSSSNSLNSKLVNIKGKTTKALGNYGRLYAYEDIKNNNAIIVRSDYLDFSKYKADSSGKFTLDIKGSKDDVKFSYNSEKAASIIVDKVQALNKKSIRIYFNQPVEIEKNADFAKVISNIYDSDKAKKTTYYYTALNSKYLRNATPIDSTHKVYDFTLTGCLNSSYYYLVVNPHITNSKENGVHDYTKNDTSGFVTMKDEDSSLLGIQQVRKFSGSSENPKDINSVSAKMKDCKTIEVCYPEAMNINGNDKKSVLNKKNYKLVDKNGKEIASHFLFMHITDIKYDRNGNKAVITLNEKLPSSESGYYVQLSKDIKNSVDTKYVKSSNGEVKCPFALSNVAAQKVEIAKGTSYSQSNRKLKIKLNEKCISLVPYDKDILFADFKITLVDANGNSYELKDSDIEKVETNIKDSYSSYDDELNVVLSSKLKLKSGEIGNVELRANSSLIGINGESSNKSVQIFVQ